MQLTEMERLVFWPASMMWSLMAPYYWYVLCGVWVVLSVAYVTPRYLKLRMLLYAEKNDLNYHKIDVIP